MSPTWELPGTLGSYLKNVDLFNVSDYVLLDGPPQNIQQVNKV